MSRDPVMWLLAGLIAVAVIVTLWAAIYDLSDPAERFFVVAAIVWIWILWRAWYCKRRRKS